MNLMNADPTTRPAGIRSAGTPAAGMSSADMSSADAALPMIELTDVSRVYRLDGLVVTALAAVTLTVRAGEFVVVLGPSGSGKTTLLNLVGGLDVASGGELRVGGRMVSGASRGALAEYRRHTTSFVFQTFNLFPGLTALENVEFAADASGRAAAATIARDRLAQVGLADRANHFPHQLSGGEQQRVAIARALATGNPVLLADEPTGELDFRTGVQVLELLRAQATADRAVLVVTHNREIARIADRVIELSSGAVVRDGPPAGGRADGADLHW